MEGRETKMINREGNKNIASALVTTSFISCLIAPEAFPLPSSSGSSWKFFPKILTLSLCFLALKHPGTSLYPLDKTQPPQPSDQEPHSLVLLSMPVLSPFTFCSYQAGPPIPPCHPLGSRGYSLAHPAHAWSLEVGVNSVTAHTDQCFFTPSTIAGKGG